ncbi:MULTISPECIES: DUF5610 domain-containing protein [unclassified Herbaspirillum]|uniref:DUF5610 domain-containing protein n=1 Tax=unclassified Herbaspirillum TaxID=2624150 RepID=UPI000E2FCFC4|nr:MULTISPECIES: DUF5610 domain-containing protein [unclassified Herbaspirillum]RFB70980.1 hypothetical protein DZB54_10185 [Herbaspirillum sp. 3R-3a1]TFI08496.1 hypothetical protein E4P32_10075 [Herbaspirillum sp. 3R11]TFI14910.1 hypothetical protein E4P31_10070 [Herbaspirillum sp. 3R-11]TFI25141.1 hypothetical protein E4P30_14210 [Herbaspirillum sp. 3C11]
MSISTNTLNTTTTPATSLPATTDAANDTTKADSAQDVKLTPAIAKQQLNAAILQSSLEVSLSSQNDPLSLVYKSAIENLNDILKPELGDNAIQNAASQDNSPEATAGRILSFIKSAFGLFSQNSKTGDSTDGADSADGADSTDNTKRDANIDKFMSLIQKGVDQGFDEARGILSSLKVLNGDIASNIDKTYEILKKGIADFVASLKNPTADDGSTPADGSSTTTSVSVSVSVTASRTTITNS